MTAPVKLSADRIMVIAASYWLQKNHNKAYIESAINKALDEQITAILDRMEKEGNDLTRNGRIMRDFTMEMKGNTILGLAKQLRKKE